MSRVLRKSGQVARGCGGAKIERGCERWCVLDYVLGYALGGVPGGVHGGVLDGELGCARGRENEIEHVPVRVAGTHPLRD